jgi:DNA/RNA endonuclease G (NUC1)
MKPIHKTLFAGLLITVSSLFSQLAVSQSVVVSQCQGQCPTYQSADASRNSKVVIHHVYAAGLNSQTGFADWVAYRLTKEAIGVASLLSRSWQPDRLVDIPGELEIMESEAAQVSLASISQSDNPYAGISQPTLEKENRARLAPITSFANTPYWTDLNNLTNMVPMPPPLRLGAWLRLEQALNTLLSVENELYIIAGPLFLITDPLSTSSAAADSSPAAYFKVVVDESGYMAFVFREGLEQSASYCDQLSPLHQIEQMSGLNLLPAIKNSVSSSLQAKLGCD